MNNEAEFVASAHNLLLKKRIEGEDRQSHINMTFNAQVSLQATRKKRFTSLDLERSQIPNIVTSNTSPIAQIYETNKSEGSIWKKFLT
jgi:hypothetical protein